MARKKVTSVPALADWGAVDNALRDIRECQHTLAEMAVQRDRQIDSIKADYAQGALPLQNRVKALESEVKAYVDLHRAELDGNHPSNGILSPEDIQQLIKRPQMQGIGAVGNAGALFTCEKVFGYSQKNAEGWFKTLKKKYPLYKGEFGKIEDALAQRIAFAEELRRDGAKYGLVFSR